MPKTETITGTIIGVRDAGSLVIIFLDAGDGRVMPVIYDHGMFRHLLQSYGPAAVVGRSVSYDGENLTFVE